MRDTSASRSRLSPRTIHTEKHFFCTFDDNQAVTAVGPQFDLRIHEILISTRATLHNPSMDWSNGCFSGPLADTTPYLPASRPVICLAESSWAFKIWHSHAVVCWNLTNIDNLFADFAKMVTLERNTTKYIVSLTDATKPIFVFKVGYDTAEKELSKFCQK